MDDKGGVSRQDRPSLDPSLLNSIQCMTKDLEKYSTLTAKAPPHLIVTMTSLELYICNVEHGAYPRAFAWLKLFKTWATLRTDDVAGPFPGSVLMTSRGLQGWFDRTKTSGTGRRIRWRPIFVSFNAWLVLDNWLEKGWDLWKNPKFAGVRDCFLPLHTSDLTSTRPIPASYHGQMVASKPPLHLVESAGGSFQPSGRRASRLGLRGSRLPCCDGHLRFVCETTLYFLEGALGEEYPERDGGAVGHSQM